VRGLRKVSKERRLVTKVVCDYAWSQAMGWLKWNKGCGCTDQIGVLEEHVEAEARGHPHRHDLEPHHRQKARVAIAAASDKRVARWVSQACVG
jgi:hypothetical protein